VTFRPVCLLAWFCIVIPKYHNSDGPAVAWRVGACTDLELCLLAMLGRTLRHLFPAHPFNTSHSLLQSCVLD
jgi:hypothetical protein